MVECGTGICYSRAILEHLRTIACHCRNLDFFSTFIFNLEVQGSLPPLTETHLG